MSRSERGSPSRLMDGQKYFVIRPAISRNESVSPDRVGQIGAFTSARNGFSMNDEYLATQPFRELCGSGLKSRTTGKSCAASASSSNEGHVITSRVTPTMN